MRSTGHCCPACMLYMTSAADGDYPVVAYCRAFGAHGFAARPGAMRVSDIQVVSAADWCQIEGRVESEADPGDPYWFEPFLLWYRFPPWCQPYLDADNGDPFLASLLVLAMQAGER